MTSLIACISEGKGTWTHVLQIIEKQQWDSVYIVTNEFGKENFKSAKKIEFIVLDTTKFLSELTRDIVSSLNGKIKDTEVALNFVSGSGKEHMALLSALLKLGLGIRLIALTPEGVKEI